MTFLADLNLRMALQEQRIRHRDRDADYRAAVTAVVEREGRPPVLAQLKRRYTLREIHLRKEFGFCLECQEFARDGHVYCETCAARRRANQQKRRNAAKHRTLVWFREKEAES